MKRTILLVAMALALSLSRGEEEPVYHVKLTVGTVQVKRHQSETWDPLDLNSTVGTKDSIRTGQEARVELETESQQVIAIGQEYQGQVEVAPATAPIRNQSAISKLVKSRSQMETTMPTAVAAIRGKTAGTIDDPEPEQLPDNAPVAEEWPGPDEEERSRRSEKELQHAKTMEERRTVREHMNRQ